MKLTIGKRLGCGFAAVLVLVVMMFAMTWWGTRDLSLAHKDLGEALRASSLVKVEPTAQEIWAAQLKETRGSRGAPERTARCGAK